MAKFKLQYSFEFYANLRELIGIGYDDPRKKKNKTKQEEGKKKRSFNALCFYWL